MLSPSQEMKVPFIDLRAQYARLKNEIDMALAELLSKGQYSGGEAVNDFENRFAAKIGSNHCVTVANGTDALFLSLKALGIGPNDEVITPAWSWISTAECISHNNAEIVFADVDPDYYTISIDEVLRKISPRTRAIIAVHLYGQAAPINELKKICVDKNIFLIEDCAQAHFTKIGSLNAGTVGHTGAFSFYPTKNLGAYGEAGCVVTGSHDVAIKIKRLSNHGALKRHDHEFEGYNSRIDTIQAAILNTKLAFIDEWNNKRRQIAAIYSDRLSTTKLQLPAVRPDSSHTYHLYVVRSDARDRLKVFLEQKGIETLIHYPAALPNLPAYRFLNHKAADFPVSSKLANEVLSLPLYPEMSHGQVNYVCDSIFEFLGSH